MQSDHSAITQCGNDSQQSIIGKDGRYSQLSHSYTTEAYQGGIDGDNTRICQLQTIHSQ